MANQEVIITLLGLGNVGSVVLNNLLMLETDRWVVNVMDPSPYIEGSWLDLNHALMIHKRHKFVLNDQDYFNKSDYVIHTVGPKVAPGGSRVDFLHQAVEDTRDVLKSFNPVKEPIVIVIANPVDVISHVTWKVTGLPHTHVIGTGTFLDTVRFEYYLAREFGVSEDAVTGLVLGEHGFSMVPILSKTSVSGIDIHKFPEKVQRAVDFTLHAANKIKETQGATKYGVSAYVTHVLDALLHKRNISLPLSVKANRENRKILGCEEVYLSLPVEIKDGKIHQRCVDELMEDEVKGLRESAEFIQMHLEQAMS